MLVSATPRMAYPKMKKNAARAIIANQEAIVCITAALAVSTVFLVGIGRYRVIAVYAVYLMLKFFEHLLKTRATLSRLLLPATVLAVYFDIAKGPVLPIYQKNYLVLGLATMVCMDVAVRSVVKKAIVTIAHGEVFVSCPSCGYDNKIPVDRCSRCSFVNAEASVRLRGVLRGDACKLPSRLSKMVGLREDEEVLFQTRLFPNKSVFVNGRRVIRKNLVVTTWRVILVDYMYFAGSWRDKDDIAIADIVRIDGALKKVTIARQPVLGISTSVGDNYEIVYGLCADYKRQMPEIARLIQQRNPRISANIVMEDKYWSGRGAR